MKSDFQEQIEFAKANATARLGDFMPFVKLHQYEIDKLYAAGVVKHGVIPEGDREWVAEMIMNPPSPPKHPLPKAETAAKKYIHWKLCKMISEKYGIPIRSKSDHDAVSVVHWAFDDGYETIHSHYKEVNGYFSSLT